MKKLLISFALILISLSINAAISQSGITNLKQLDKNGIIDLVNGNQLTAFISDGPFEGPITQTYFKNGTYETVYENKKYKGKWRAEGELNSSIDDKKMCTKNDNASNWSCFAWYTGIKDGGTYAYVVAQGKIFHQYHEVISADQANNTKRETSAKKDTSENKDTKYVRGLKEFIDNETKRLKVFLKTLTFSGASSNNAVRWRNKKASL